VRQGDFLQWPRKYALGDHVHDDARAYVRMLRVVGRAIKRGDRRAEIVTAGLPSSKLRSAVPIGAPSVEDRKPRPTTGATDESATTHGWDTPARRRGGG
jgi:hypothetical protein